MPRAGPRLADIGERVDLLVEAAHPHDAHRRLIKHLRHERHAMFSFLTIDGVDAAHWRAEHGVRPAVVNRKVWGGNPIRPGAKTQGRLMTFLRTAHQHGADAIAMLVELGRAPTRVSSPGSPCAPAEASVLKSPFAGAPFTQFRSA